MGDIGQTGDDHWWKSTTVYQVWPASYKDSNGSGVGDIPGIISTLPYLHALGVETMWLSPMYKSPQKDMGYDISDYEDIHAPYGTLDDMQALIDGLHLFGMKIILDLVINHTSDEHAWFQESKKSKDNSKADWYIWKNARYADGKRSPPNNWKSFFGGSAWEYVPERDQYYLHLFVKEQPDLNWENEETRKSIYDTSMRFWLKRGVDGFRIDTCNIYSKTPGLPDAEITDPTDEFQDPHKLVVDGPHAHQYLQEMHKVFDEFGDVMTVGELGLADTRKALLRYVDASRKELREVFEFSMFVLGLDRNGPAGYHHFKLSELKKSWVKGQDIIEGSRAWTTTFGENHDAGRSISRFATRDTKWESHAAKVLATMIATMSGTLFLYQGQEIGMTNFPASWGPEEYKDVSSINYLKRIETTYGRDSEMWKKAMYGLNQMARDHARTPVQWNDSEHAGFTTGTPWMRVNDNYKQINAASQINDPDSVLSYWKRMLVVRNSYQDTLVYGRWELLDAGNENTFCFYKHSRHDDGTKALVELNFTDKEQDGYEIKKSREIILTNVYQSLGGRLGPWEARISIIKTNSSSPTS